MTSLPRICISSTSGGGGKTLLSLGLGRALKNSGHTVKPFKKGPDYIDAAWLALACGNPATNLDLFFMDSAALRKLFTTAMLELYSMTGKMPLALIEGNRGLFDGLDESGSCSTSGVARTLECPVLLCINCMKATRTVAAIIKGMETFEQGLNFCGVVLNRVGSSRHEASLRKALEYHTGIPVLGALPRMEHNPLPERHMGIASRGAGLASSADSLLDEISAFISSHCDLDAMLKAVADAPPLEDENRFPATDIRKTSPNKTIEDGKPVIGYVHDEALWFYYPDNLAALENSGASLKRLSLLDNGDANLHAWENLDGLYLGGGFPEDFARELSDSPFLQKISSYADAGMPIYAECGGLMLLCRKLSLESGDWPMCGVFAADVEWSAKPGGLGYVEGQIMAVNPFFPQGTSLRGHEFHYSSCKWEGDPPAFAMRLARGTGISGSAPARGRDGLVYKNVWGAYTHIFAPAIPEWAENFVRAARSWQGRKK